MATNLSHTSKPQRRDLFYPPTLEEAIACWELCRLHNNIGFWVVWLPTAWSISMAYHADTQLTSLEALKCALKYIPLCFGIKSFIVALDDVLDADIDAQVERTKGRPLPRGSISKARAQLFVISMGVLGIPLSYVFLSAKALHFSMIVWPLYIIYPTCKRWTNLAPVPLGIMANIGMFMGWSDIKSHGDTDHEMPLAVVVPMYVGAVIWMIVYETIYQHQDKVDDRSLGLYSPALLLGDTTLPVCSCLTMGFVTCLVCGGIFNSQGPSYFLGVACVGFRLLSKLTAIDINKPQDCRAFFMDTVVVGQILLGSIVLDGILNRLSTGASL